MSLMIISSDILLDRLEKVARKHGERNMTLLQVKGKADKTIFGDDFKGRNEVVI